MVSARRALIVAAAASAIVSEVSAAATTNPKGTPAVRAQTRRATSFSVYAAQFGPDAPVDTAAIAQATGEETPSTDTNPATGGRKSSKANASTGVDTGSDTALTGAKPRWGLRSWLGAGAGLAAVAFAGVKGLVPSPFGSALANNTGVEQDGPVPPTTAGGESGPTTAGGAHADDAKPGHVNPPKTGKAKEKVEATNADSPVDVKLPTAAAAPVEPKVQIVIDTPVQAELEIVGDAPLKSKLEVVGGAPLTSELEVVGDAPVKEEPKPARKKVWVKTGKMVTKKIPRKAKKEEKTETPATTPETPAV